MAVKERGQLGLDERIVEDAELERLLIARADRHSALASVRAQFEEADAEAKTALERLKLADGDVVRIGAFRVEKVVTPPRAVSFETEEKSRLRIEAD